MSFDLSFVTSLSQSELASLADSFAAEAAGGDVTFVSAVKRSEQTKEFTPAEWPKLPPIVRFRWLRARSLVMLSDPAVPPTTLEQATSVEGFLLSLPDALVRCGTGFAPVERCIETLRRDIMRQSQSARSTGRRPRGDTTFGEFDWNEEPGAVKGGEEWPGKTWTLPVPIEVLPHPGAVTDAQWAEIRALGEAGADNDSPDLEPRLELARKMFLGMVSEPDLARVLRKTVAELPTDAQQLLSRIAGTQPGELARQLAASDVEDVLVAVEHALTSTRTRS